MRDTSGDLCGYCGHRRDRHTSGAMCAGEAHGETYGSECYCGRLPDAPDFATEDAAGVIIAAVDQAKAAIAELAGLLASGRWTSSEICDAGRRLAARATT